MNQTTSTTQKNVFRSLWIKKFGAPSIFEMEEKYLEQKDLKSDEILIDVHYSGINFADIIMRQGLYKDAPKRPFVPGYEVSGIVTHIGNKVAHLKVGDEVMAGSLFGGYASKMRLPAWMAFKLPNNLSMEEGAALPVNFITAYVSLYDMGRVRAGDQVVVDCASGGVGVIALQMLKSLGAVAYGLTSSPDKLDFIESFGAKALTHEVFFRDYKNIPFDFILNSQGGASVKKHYEYLGPTGRMVCLGVSSGISAGKRDLLKIAKTVLTMPKFSLLSMFDQNKGVFALNALKLMENNDYIKKLMGKFSLISELNLKPHIGKIFNYTDIGLAHEFIEAKKAKGKVLISWKE